MNGHAAHPCVLLTGANGFLGAQIARRLIREPGLTVIALVRAEDQAAAEGRLARAWWDWPELAQALVSRDRRVEVLAGDVSLPHLGLDEPVYQTLAERVSHIIHSAADLRFDAPLDELRKTNLQGTANIVELAKSARHEHAFQRLAHVSTAYVAGRRKGVIAEGDLSGEHGFNNGYEQSKYEAECLVQAARSELPITIFRPGMVVGAADSGEIRTFNTVYYPLRMYLSGKHALLPLDPSLPVNIVPVDYVAEAIVRLTFREEAQGQTFHLTAPFESLPRLGELVECVREWARAQHGLRLPRPVYLRLPLPGGLYRPERASRRPTESRGKSWRDLIGADLRGLLVYLPYFKQQKQFRRDNLDRLLGTYPLDWREFLPRLLAFAVSHGFMHLSGRTVHEQLLARLGSRRRPLHYFDIIAGRVIPRSAEELRREILAAAGALTALGVRPGERVAIVGLNSSRYLALDTAIGLIGAVSVPLYYTSPPAEIDHILAASGAKVLLAGAPKILARLDEIQTNLPVVSFWREPVPAEIKREVTAWEAFLALGAGYQAPRQAPVGLGDLATLRYTSGTTGQPKGVSFQHQQLRWMGQTMASLLPVKAVSRSASYLSCLPMNHVVEGILATYCTYYVPVPLNIYFLENLYDIQQALPRVRPTIFFSVPRIYERIWQALERNPLGRRYLSLPGGMLKRTLGALVRRRTLQKAGLERCAQLISGSAPCGAGLLNNFRELGIEIYNAYGLSEAPLVSMNRLGVNRLGTVGIALPETEIHIAEDGEVLVRGPQVMAGYFQGQAGEQMNQPISDGWLQTGDLGSLSADGSLILTGRKKELFKTSYGKYVQPAKVEALLREIPGVAEAMLVGEQRPFCTALLWVQDQPVAQGAVRRIDDMIVRINRNLSHPEQVKRWALLPYDLSVETGDLTPNLKLKRQAIARRLDGVLQGLYDGCKPQPAVLHFGLSEKR